MVQLMKIYWKILKFIKFSINFIKFSSFSVIFLSFLFFYLYFNSPFPSFFKFFGPGGGGHLLPCTPTVRHWNHEICLHLCNVFKFYCLFDVMQLSLLHLQVHTLQSPFDIYYITLYDFSVSSFNHLVSLCVFLKLLPKIFCSERFKIIL